MITVSEFQKEFLDLNVQLLAGEKGVHKVIDYLTVQEFSLKSDRIHPNGFIMTAFSGFKNTCEIMDHFKWYARTNVSGVCFHTVIYPEVPQELIDLANQVNVPLFRIPSNIPYHVLYKKYNDLIYEKSTGIKTEIENLNESMLEALLLEKDIHFVIQSIGKYIHEPVVYLDHEKKIISLWGTNDISRSDLLNWVERKREEFVEFFNEVRIKRKMLHVDDFNKNTFFQSTMIVPLYSKHDFYGYLIVGNQNKEVYFRDLVLKNTVTVLILDAMKKSQTKEFLKNKDINLLEEIFTSNKINHISIDQFYYDVRKVKSLMIVEPGQNIDVMKCYQLIDKKIKDYDLNSLIWIMDKRILVLLQKEMLFDEVFKEKIEKFTIGMSGRLKEISTQGIKLLYEQAKISVHMARIKQQTVCEWNNLGVEKITYFMKESPLLQDYYVDYLFPLIKYDNENNTQLIKTLYVYLNTFFSLKETGELLHLHHNTVKYRIKKIQQLVNLSFHDNEQYINVMLAFKNYFYNTDCKDFE